MTEKILHLSIDNSFTEIALKYFEEIAPKKNVIIKYKGKKLKTFDGNVIYIDNFSNIDNSIYNEYKYIVIHGLSTIWFDFLLKFPLDVKFIWVGWGYDYYDMCNDNLILPKTKILEKKVEKRRVLRFLYKRTLGQWILKNNNKKKKMLIERINYFAPVLKNEYELVRGKYLYLNRFPEYLAFNYGALENDFIKGFEEYTVCGNDILIGNSSTPTNNHLEVFDLLKRLAVNSKIICPLSYGDVKYADEIVNYGNKLFKENFFELRNFMPIDEYTKTIISCGNVIMNHIRQQGMGNILLMIYLGAKIFLRSENPTYQFLILNGLKVYSIDELMRDPGLLNYSFNTHEIKSNRENLKKIWGKDIVVNKTRHLIEKLSENIVEF